jgi:hypothetical protein
MHLAVAADDGVRMAAMQIKRVDFNWATAGSNLYLVSECGPGLQQCPPFTEDPQGRSSAAHRSGAQGTASVGVAQSIPYGRIYMRQLWCRPMRADEEKVYPLVILCNFATPAARTIRPTSDPIQPVLRCSWIGAGAPLYSRMIRRRDLN